ncbi:MAG: peptidoglycan editing factor PgeF [Spirochaetales bacterium]|nr:peptidoglycan editing factor PgeF [Spirochaetales bacterium]
MTTPKTMTPLVVEWTAPPRVKALQTTRQGGVSQGAWEGANMALHVGDDPAAVQQNRQDLLRWIPQPPLWLNQTHSARIVDADQSRAREQNTVQAPPEADGAVTSLGNVLAIMTADCLPVLAYSRETQRIGAFHAGWRGLAGAILAGGIRALGGAPENQDWWVGPGIGPQAYEVGVGVKEAFLRYLPEHEKDFLRTGDQTWQLNLAQAARRQLLNGGVIRITISPWTTSEHQDLFWSYRKQNPCGRTASLIWREE